MDKRAIAMSCSAQLTENGLDYTNGAKCNSVGEN